MAKTIEGLKNEIIAAESNIVMCEKSIENCNRQIENFVEFFNYGLESDKNVNFLTVPVRGIADALQAIASYENDIANYRKKISMCEKEVAEIENTENTENTAKITETIYLANTGAYSYKLENGEGLDDYYFKKKLHAAIKSGAKIRIRNGLTLYGWIDFSPFEMPSIEICDANKMTENVAAIIEYPNNAKAKSKIEVELNDFYDWKDEKYVENIVVKVNGLDVIYYGYGFGPDYHEYDDKLLHINVDRNANSLEDSEYDEFKTYKTRKSMNKALAKYGLTLEQIEQFFKNEELKLAIDDYIIDVDTAAEVEIENAENAKVEEVKAEKNSLKAKVAEILNRPHKSVIDWKDAIFQNVTLQEIFKLQKDMKKFLKLGEMKLAENVFNNIKLIFKAAA